MDEQYEQQHRIISILGLDGKYCDIELETAIAVVRPMH